MKKYSENEIAKWIIDNMSAEFIASHGYMESTLTAVYYIHIDEDGELVSDINAAADTITESIDITAYKDDESPDRFYAEFETVNNPKFCELIKTLTKKVNAAI